MENSNIESCTNCKFFLGSNARPREKGICRRHPPVYVYFLDRDEDDDYFIHADESFPAVVGGLWCGEFKRN